MSESRHPDTERLSAYLEGEVPGAERRRIGAHLETCDRCGAAVEELREIVRRAGSLNDREPERDLWPAVARAIVAGEEAPASVEPPQRRRFGRRGLELSVVEAAAAAVALIVLSAGTAWMAHPAGSDDPSSVVEAPVEATATTATAGGPAPAGYAEELEALQESLQRNRGRLDPNTVRVLEKNLAVIDRALQESRRALDVDPGNRFLEEHLERTYRTKLDYLRQAVRAVEWSS